MNVEAGRERLPWGLGASLALHGGLLLALILVPVPRLKPSAPPQSVAVDILSLGQFEAMRVARRIARAPVPQETTPLVATEPAVPQAAAEPAPEAARPPVPGEKDQQRMALAPVRPRRPERAREMIRATQLLSARVLADPRSRDARSALATYEDSERMVQLCGIEAMEQVHAWDAKRQPDRVVAYARERVKIDGHRLQADGAAIRSGGRWYALKFDCRLTPSHEAVADFAFAFGTPIPVEDLERLALDTADDPDD